MRDRSGFFAAIGGFLGLIGGVSSVGEIRQNITLTILATEVGILQLQVASLFGTVKKLGQTFGKALKHIISDIIHGRFLHLWHDYLTLKAKLKAWFEKHLGWLLRLRKAFDEWFRRTIVPILNLIQRVRAVLAIFRIFHFKFAEKLDALLGRLEARIIRNTLALRAKINEISTIINLVLDPSLVIRQNVLLQSIRSALRQAMAALGIPIARKLSGAEEQRQKEDAGLLKRGTVLVSGGAPTKFHPAIERILDSLDTESKVYL